MSSLPLFPWLPKPTPSLHLERFYRSGDQLPLFPRELLHPLVSEDDIYWLGMARMVASRSKDPSTKCGAVLVRPDGSFASSGRNGFAKGIDDDVTIFADRERKLRRVIHAEDNALSLCRDHDTTGYTMYVWPMPSCSKCAGKITHAGIRRVVSPSPSPTQMQRWGEDFLEGQRQFRENPDPHKWVIQEFLDLDLDTHSSFKAQGAFAQHIHLHHRPCDCNSK